MTTNEAADAISKNSYVQIGLVLVFIGGAFWFGSEKTQISASQEAMSKDISYIRENQQEIKELLRERTESRWTKLQMDNWVKAFRVMNPEITVPDTDNIPTIIHN